VSECRVGDQEVANVVGQVERVDPVQQALQITEKHELSVPGLGTEGLSRLDTAAAQQPCSARASGSQPHFIKPQQIQIVDTLGRVPDLGEHVYEITKLVRELGKDGAEDPPAEGTANIRGQRAVCQTADIDVVIDFHEPAREALAEQHEN